MVRTPEGASHLWVAHRRQPPSQHSAHRPGEYNPLVPPLTKELGWLDAQRATDLFDDERHPHRADRPRLHRRVLLRKTKRPADQHKPDVTLSPAGGQPAQRL